MSRKRVIGILGFSIAFGFAAGGCRMAPTAAGGQADRRGGPDRAATIEVPLTEGTSMSDAVSPDGRTLAMDLQGSIWTMPATAARRSASPIS